MSHDENPLRTDPPEPAPIGLDRFVCMAPWVHAHLSSLGGFTPCCEIFIPPETEGSGTIEDWWNGRRLSALRLEMLSGAPPAICRKCHEKEQSGIPSLRLRFNERHPDEVARLAATGADGSLPAGIEPIDFDLRFSNLCNFRCRSCWHGASSRWFSDAKELGLAQGNAPIIDAGVDRGKVIADVMARAATMRDIYFAGGEPLLMAEHYRLLNHLISIDRTDVRLHYSSNLSELSLGQTNVVDLWRHFPDVRLEASVDGLGAAGELIRKGKSWPQFEENLRKIRTACPHLRLRLRITVSLFNIFQLPQLYAYAHGTLKIEHDDILMSALQEPVHYNIQSLPPALKARLAARLADFAATLPSQSAAALAAIVRFMQLRDSSHAIADFRKITRRLDEIRHEDTYRIIPELRQLRAPLLDRIVRSFASLAGFGRRRRMRR